MNLFTGKNFKSDECIFDVHSFARELDEDTLRTEINGGSCGGDAPSAPSPSVGGNPPSAPAVTATTPTTNPGTTPQTNSGTQNPSNPSNPSPGPTGPGYEAPPEVMSNPQAYAYWRAMQALAEQEGNPDKYKDYNILGIQPSKEDNFVKQVLGQKGLNLYKSANKHVFSIDGRSGSFPSDPITNKGHICYDQKVYMDPLGNDPNTFIHEIYHQFQYHEGENFINKCVGMINFKGLVNEFIMNETIAQNGVAKVEWVDSNSIIGGRPKVTISDPKLDYTYDYDKTHLEKYETISDIPFQEAQAQFVGDYGENYYKARFGEGLDSNDTNVLQQMSRIMANSGFGDTEAYKWITTELK